MGYSLHPSKITLSISLLPIKIQSRKISLFTNQNREEINIVWKIIRKEKYIMTLEEYELRNPSNSNHKNIKCDNEQCRSNYMGYCTSNDVNRYGYGMCNIEESLFQEERLN